MNGRAVDDTVSVS